MPIHKSLYWRITIAVSICLFVAPTLQQATSMYLLVEARAAASQQLPHNVSLRVATNLGAALARDANVDVEGLLSRELSDGNLTAYVVMTDGRSWSSTGRPPDREVREFGLAAIRDGAPELPLWEPPSPLVTAPVHLGRELVGLVLMPSIPRGQVSHLTRFISVPNTLIVVLGAVVAATLVFRPAHLRLRALERVARRIGNGDLQARAPERGDDEITSVARAFNQMASEIAIRDERLREVDRFRRRLLAEAALELGASLGAIREWSDTLQGHDTADAATKARYLGNLDMEAYRLEKLIEDLRRASQCRFVNERQCDLTKG